MDYKKQLKQVAGAAREGRTAEGTRLLPGGHREDATSAGQSAGGGEVD